MSVSSRGWSHAVHQWRYISVFLAACAFSCSCVCVFLPGCAGACEGQEGSWGEGVGMDEGECWRECELQGMVLVFSRKISKCLILFVQFSECFLMCFLKRFLGVFSMFSPCFQSLFEMFSLCFPHVFAMFSIRFLDFFFWNSFSSCLLLYFSAQMTTARFIWRVRSPTPSTSALQATS